MSEIRNTTPSSKQANGLMLTDAERISLESVQTIDPDDLLETSKRSILIPALCIALVVHLLIIGLTSFSLYGDWKKYGWAFPSEIKQMKIEEEKAAKKARREAEQAAAAAKAAAKAGDAEENTGEAKSPGDENPGDGEKDPPADDDPKIPDDVDPSDPLKSFDLDPGDLGL